MLILLLVRMLLVAIYLRAKAGHSLARECEKIVKPHNTYSERRGYHYSQLRMKWM